MNLHGTFYSSLKKINLVILLWVPLTIININKAYHIDDTFHLEAANWIKQHPLRPMSGTINWYDSPTPMYEHNQPPLFFYLMAFTQLFFGKSEIVMHLLISIFTFLSLYFFNKLAILLNVNHRKTILTIFAFCPAFIVNQNVMVDVPILSLSLGTVYFLLKAQNYNTYKDYLISSCILSIGLLMKYSLIPLLVILLYSIIISGNYKKIIMLLIPILILTLWSYWNKYEFGSIHLFNRPKSVFQIKHLLAYIGTLGSMSPFAIAILYWLHPKKIMKWIILFTISIFIIIVILVYYKYLSELKVTIFLNYFFIFIGFIIILFVTVNFIKSVFSKKYEYIKSNHLIIFLCISGISSFIILFAPFNATRHVLMIIPFILLLTHKNFEKSKGIINRLAMISTITLGILLGISDWVYADFYRNKAIEIEIPDHTIWSCGHWGWQWYSYENGMKIYSTTDEISVRNGDIFVYPLDISRQTISNDIVLETIDKITEPTNFLTFFSGKYSASMYNSFLEQPAWTLSNTTIDTILICKVKKEITVSDIVDRMKHGDKWLKSIKERALKKDISVDSMMILEAEWMINQKRKIEHHENHDMLNQTR